MSLFKITYKVEKNSHIKHEIEAENIISALDQARHKARLNSKPEEIWTVIQIQDGEVK